MRPRILVTSAAGRTGSATVNQLLEKGSPVRAFVRRKDARSDRLARAGAEIFVGDQLDIRDLREALVDVQRAYHCPPVAENTLHNSMLFALAAEEAKLEVVALMSGWNPHSTHPSINTREQWMANNIYRWMPSVKVIHINPGIFAFMYFLSLPAVKHFGTLMLPFGDGLNAPPSNEDIAAVAAAVLVDPEEHIGKTYRPTGPKLISAHDVAEIFGRVLGRKVRYQNVSTRMFLKAAKAQGLSKFELAQIGRYAQELSAGAYAVGAPTNHVAQVTGRPAEGFETIARRYIGNPEKVMRGFEIGSKWSAVKDLVKTILTPVPKVDRWEAGRGYPLLTEPVLAHDSEEWRNAAQQKTLVLQDSVTDSILPVTRPDSILRSA